MSASKLVKPSVEYKDSFLDALRELQDERRYLFLDTAEIAENFETFVNDLNQGKRHMHRPYPDWVEPVPETTLWLVKDGGFIGLLNIRHRLNWHLEKWGGHLSFMIRPSMRGKGFGKKILTKGVPFAAHFGIDKALITIDPKNENAIKAVEFAGGKFEDETNATERFPSRRRYWLDTH
jgi:predicted acetyltransferase